jgi:hypothetical protein
MAAPTYTWEFNSDLFGDRVPKIVTLEAASGLYTKVGTLLAMASGQVRVATDGDGEAIIGLAAQVIAVAATAADPVKVAVLAPGMVIKGTANADASAYTGLASKLQDIDADQSLDPDDQTGGFLSVLRTEDAGLTVFCVVVDGALVA